MREFLPEEAKLIGSNELNSSYVRSRANNHASDCFLKKKTLYLHIEINFNTQVYVKCFHKNFITSLDTHSYNKQNKIYCNYR